MSNKDDNRDEAVTPGGPNIDTASTMRLRAELPRVTRLSRKVLAGVGLVASIGIGGALIYALQTREGGPGNEELYSTENRATADGLAGLPRDYTGPVLGPLEDDPVVEPALPPLPELEGRRRDPVAAPVRRPGDVAALVLPLDRREPVVEGGAGVHAPRLRRRDRPEL